MLLLLLNMYCNSRTCKIMHIIYILKIGVLFCFQPHLNSPKPWGPLLHFRYCQKALNKEDCMFVNSQFFEVMKQKLLIFN
jgi:hypothetical protein